MCPPFVGQHSKALRWLITALGYSSPRMKKRFLRMMFSGVSLRLVVYIFVAILTMRPSFFILAMKLLVVLSEDAITISWFNKAFFSINPCFYFAKVVKFSKRRKVLWIFLEIQSFLVVFHLSLSTLSPLTVWFKKLRQSPLITVHTICLYLLFHPHFFHYCNIWIAMSFVVSVLCCNILALNFSTPFAFSFLWIPLPLCPKSKL